MKADAIQERLAEFFRERDIDAMASWPDSARTDHDSPRVLVSLEKMTCAPAGMQNYLGQWVDETTGQETELYGHSVHLSFLLDILALPETGTQACRELFDRMLLVLQKEKPIALSVRELNSEEMEYDGKDGLLRLRCHLECAGWLCTQGDEAGTFLDFTLRGDINT